MKQLLKLILPVTGRKGVLKYMLLGVVTGLCGFTFINSVTRIIAIMIADNFTVIKTEYVIMFMAIILVYVWSRRALALTSMSLSLRITWTLRKQILSLVLRAHYWQVVGRIPRIQTAVMNDVAALTNASLNAIDLCISIIVATACFVYLATISIALFAITVFVAIVGITVYYISSKRNISNLQRSRRLENVFQANFNSILNGFKEIYIEPAKGNFIYGEKICTNANESYKHSVWAAAGFINNQMIGQVLFYLLVAAVLLVFSVMLNIRPAEVVSFIFTLLYLQGSIESIMVQLPVLARARVAAEQLMNLRTELEEVGTRNSLQYAYSFNEPFERLTVCGLTFGYNTVSSGFHVGPVSFEARKGETIFIYGSNGSGKTTFIYALLSLYMPENGTIAFNDTLIDETNYEGYKRLFAVIFSNFYLFNEILTIESPDRGKWDYYLHLFELEGKVKLEGNSFSTVDLSTGQRKRLALIVALLEKKPLLILDEWAADQDPYFRKKFYTVILPLLNKEGFTIIAITHDDKYYPLAHKLYSMHDGKLTQIDLEAYRRAEQHDEKSMFAN